MAFRPAFSLILSIGTVVTTTPRVGTRRNIRCNNSEVQKTLSHVTIKEFDTIGSNDPTNCTDPHSVRSSSQ
ncbi:hypothetical protein BDZ91DRAFT_183083 [Kalaharituber pfeilii]|nr:hypothetical protein BDZ91DRAFT_183083 [Kalaharituber pfeilii]